MAEKKKDLFGGDQTDIAIDNIVFVGLDDIIAALLEAQKAASEDGNNVRWDDLERMKRIIQTARAEIENLLKQIGKRGKIYARDTHFSPPGEISFSVMSMNCWRIPRSLKRAPPSGGPLRGVSRYF
jgi:hypothetical protein